ncbi:CDP-glycerol glycerophosphotransferase family protein [Apibacter raozihei]|uniref:CDP-glycerol glycerophosphotransferase family protein n=1 Tax=Apibacter raozihei TaxID=2500547 RepID=UPI001E5D770C|nr:CDP-glycerol glycerophosphotransferase family protein [Apibacter raozihei]
MYKLFENDERFEPLILVCPYESYGNEIMVEYMDKAYEGFKSKGYRIKKALNKDGTWINVEKELKPDIIFFTNPHRLSKPEYLIENYKNYLTGYVPYNFGNSHMLNLFHDQDFHNQVWKIFAETDIHKKYSVDIARNRGKNVVVTGFPGTDDFLLEDKNIDKSIFWKHKNTKKLIWAPHHTIDDDKNFISFSSFLVYYDYIFKILDQYKGKLEIVFKPHPLLKIKLYEHEKWGKERTDRYYQKWSAHAYGNLNDSDYVDLFKTSDAMIHDSGSFLIEYLYTSKPVLRTDIDDSICKRLNTFGVMAYSVHYLAKNYDEIDLFIKQVLDGEDPKKEEREIFKKNYLLPPGNNLASHNIYNYIKEQIE